MSDTTALIITTVVVILIFAFIYWLDRRSKPKKPLQEPVIADDQGITATSALLRLITILILGIAAIVATFYGTIWVRTNPIAGLPVVIGVIVLHFLLKPLHAIRILYKIYRSGKEKSESQ